MDEDHMINYFSSLRREVTKKLDELNIASEYRLNRLYAKEKKTIKKILLLLIFLKQIKKIIFMIKKLFQIINLIKKIIIKVIILQKKIKMIKMIIIMKQ